MDSVVRFSLKQKVLFNLLFILLTVCGFFALFALPAERYPDINMAMVNITTDYPGASPVDVETLVTRKLEEAIEGIENIEWISSSSRSERSYIKLKFVDDSDYENLYDEVRLNILNAKEDIPVEADPPNMEIMKTGDLFPVVIINISGEHNNRALSLMAEQVKASLKTINGVKKVVISGDFVREFHIYLDPEKLKLYGISFDEAALALQDVNLSITAGKYKKKDQEYLIKVDEKLHDRDSVVKTIIRRDGDGGFIRLQDLITHADFDYRSPNVISTVNGKTAVSLRVIKTPAGNSLSIKAEMLKVLEQFQPLFSRENLEVTLTQDSTVKVNEGLSTLGWNLAVGMLLVSIITWYFMGIRNAGLVTIGIPFSFLMAMLLMFLTNYSFNEITLFAFVLVTGIIVDDAIVVTENIYRYIQLGHQIHDAIIEGLAEVAVPIISSTLTTVVAFLPMFLMPGMVGEFFAQIPATVCYALLASLFECIFILSIHYLDFGPQKAKHLSQRLDEDNFIVAFFRAITEKILRWTLKLRFLTLILLLMLFILSMGIMYVSMTGVLPLVKTQFFPDDYAIYFVDIKGPPNTSIEDIDQKARKISSFITAQGAGKAESAAGFAGFYLNEDYESVFGNNFGVVLVTLPAKEKQTISNPMQHLDAMRKILKKEFELNGYMISVHAMKDGPPSGKPINIKVKGSSISSVAQLTDDLLKFLKNNDEITPYLIELEDNRGVPKDIYRFDVRHDWVKEYNLDSGDVTRLAGSVLDGRYIGKFRSHDEEIDLKLFIDIDTMDTPEQALSIPVVENSVKPVLLGDVTELKRNKEPGELHRYQGQRTISIKSDLTTGAPISPAFVVNKVSDYYDSIRDIYPGATILFSGEYENTQKSYQSLIFSFVIAVMIIYTILAVQFQSYLQPVIILCAIIFALIGIILGKFITQSIFTVNSFIAVIGVVGVVVNDALVLIDFMNKGYRSGLTRRESIDNAVSIRLRPIILTTLTTMLGLLPMAIGIPDYSIVWGSMASTFVAGIGAATLLTLWVVPVLWDLIQARQEKT